MNNFWNNIRRYPSFFISSVAGLIIVILTPFTGSIKTPKSRLILIGFITISLTTVFLIIRAMLVL